MLDIEKLILEGKTIAEIVEMAEDQATTAYDKAVEGRMQEERIGLARDGLIDAVLDYLEVLDVKIDEKSLDNLVKDLETSLKNLEKSLKGTTVKKWSTTKTPFRLINDLIF